MVRDQLKALVKLAAIDDSASGIDKELKELPENLAETRADVDRLASLLATEQQGLAEAEELASAFEQQISQSNEQLAKAKAKGAKARNAREVEAAEREMDIVRRGIKEREEEQLRLVAAIEQKRKSLDDRQKKLAELEQLYKDDEVQARGRIEELLAERARVTTGRDQLAAAVGGALVKRYDRIREKRGSALAKVIDQTCKGCRVQLPPQVVADMHRAEEIFQCPQCNRLLYVEAHVMD